MCPGPRSLRDEGDTCPWRGRGSCGGCRALQHHCKGLCTKRCLRFRDDFFSTPPPPTVSQNLSGCCPACVSWQRMYGKKRVYYSLNEVSPGRGTFWRLKVQGTRLSAAWKGVRWGGPGQVVAVGSAHVGEHSKGVGGLFGGYPCPLGPAGDHRWSWSIRRLGWELCWCYVPGKIPPLFLSSTSR